MSAERSTEAIPIWPTKEEFAALVRKHMGVWIMDTETTGLDVRGPRAQHDAKYVGLMPQGSPTVASSLGRASRTSVPQ